MPNVIGIAGPNGAGKSTAAPALLRDLLQLKDFVNADDIARGLSAFQSEKAAMEAGRLMIARLRELADLQQDFAFETTLASRSFAPWIAQLRADHGYEFRLMYLWVPSAELSISRVAGRVRKGGHHVPDDAIRRRYVGGVRNFFDLYQPIADRWEVYNNGASPRELVAEGRKTLARVYDNDIWQRLLEAKS